MAFPIDPHYFQLAHTLSGWYGRLIQLFTMLVFIPSVIHVFNWTATLWSNPISASAKRAVPFKFLVAAIAFLIYGATAYINGLISIDSGMQAVNYRVKRADWNMLEHEAMFEEPLILLGRGFLFVAQAEDPGSWMFMCMLPYHMQFGMMGEIAAEGMFMPIITDKNNTNVLDAGAPVCTEGARKCTHNWQNLEVCVNGQWEVEYCVADGWDMCMPVDGIKICMNM